MIKHDISIAVIGNYNIIKYAVCYALKATGFNVTIEADDINDFKKRLKNIAAPSLCMLYIGRFPGEEYISAGRIKKEYPKIKILAYTMHERQYPKLMGKEVDAYFDMSLYKEELEALILYLMRD